MWIKEKWGELAAVLDRGGFPAWLAATILGFIIFWPIGLFFLFNMIFFRKGNTMCKGPHRRQMSATHNSAFENYRQETLNRLDEERAAFSEYLNRLRQARDQQEFDGWMNEFKSSKSAEA